MTRAERTVPRTAPRGAAPPAAAATVPVRVVAPGVSGADLADERRAKAGVGQVWRSGAYRIRITAVALNLVKYRVLVGDTVRGATHIEAKSSFLRTFTPEGK